jgi:general secretion pathway protein L
MLSLIVALAPPTPAAGGIRFAVSGDAAPGLPRPDAAGDASVADHGNAPLALLPRADEVVAVVPARMLSWHRIVLPKVNAARLRSALEGTLEERLLDEPASLHFALAPGAAAGSQVWVATCDKAWLQAALHVFEEAGRPVARVVPEFAPLPDGSSPAFYVTGSPESARLVRCAADGVQMLPLSVSAGTALGLDTTTDTVWAEPAVAAGAEQTLQAKVRVRHGAQGLVSAARSGWDMAQFDLASTGGTRLLRRAGLLWAQWATGPAWRPARWGLAALVAANLLGLNAWAWKEQAALEAKRAEVKGLLTRSFPKVPVVVDAPVQMEREVAALRQATGAVSSRDLEPMLATISENAQAARSPSAIEFVANELTLRGFQPSPQEVAMLTRGLAAAGYRSRTEGDAWVISTGARR